MHCTDELMIQKSSSPNRDEDLKMDIEVVEEMEDCLQKFQEQKSEQSVDKLMNQESPSPDVNVDFNVEATIGGELKDCLEKFKKQGRDFEIERNFDSDYVQAIAGCENKVEIEALKGQVDTVDANEKRNQENDEDIPEIKDENMSKPSESFENVLMNTDSSDSSVYEDTNQGNELKFCLDNIWTTSENTDNTVGEVE